MADPPPDDGGAFSSPVSAQRMETTMSGLIPRGHAERGNWFRQLAHVVHLGRCTRFPFGDCNRHEESEYFTPKDNDIASVVIRWLEFDQDCGTE